MWARIATGMGDGLSDRGDILVVAAMWLVFVNVWTARCFRHDKRQAIAGGRRIPEADLLALAAVGGSVGALVARAMFRHKTRKEPFSTRLMMIAAAQIGGGGALLLF